MSHPPLLRRGASRLGVHFRMLCPFKSGDGDVTATRGQIVGMGQGRVSVGRR